MDGLCLRVLAVFFWLLKYSSLFIIDGENALRRCSDTRRYRLPKRKPVPVSASPGVHRDTLTFYIKYFTLFTCYTKIH